MEMLIVIAVIGILSAIAIPLLGSTTDKAKERAAQRNAQNLCQLYNAAALVNASFTDNTSKQAIAEDLAAGVTGVDVESSFGLSLSEEAIMAALEYCTLDADTNLMIYNMTGGVVDEVGEEEDGIWGPWEEWGHADQIETILQWVQIDSSKHSGGTIEYRVDPNNPYKEQKRTKL